MKKHTPLANTNDPWFEALSRGSDIGILMFDKDGRPQFTSGLAIQLLRCEDTDDLKQALEPLVELVSSSNDRCRNAKLGGELADAHIEFEVRSSDGTHLVAASAHSIRTDDCVGVLVLLRDRDRELLVQRDLRMASQFRNVGQLYQAIAHDLRSPVGNIIMAASLVRAIGDEALEPKSEQACQFEQWLETIEEASSTLDQSLNLLLGELTATDEHTEKFELSDTIDSILKIIAPQARKANITLKTSDGAEAAVISGSPARIKLALLNIATNAIQAMGDGGDLEILKHTENNCTEITIRDTGPGIEPIHLERIFDRYYTTKSFGTGIGLHISRSIIEQHGGTLAVESTVGEGATFKVTLPVC